MKKRVKTKEQMKVANDRRAKRKFISDSKACFTENDYIITIEFLPAALPSSEAELKKAIQRYFERVRYHRKKSALNNDLMYNFAVTYDKPTNDTKTQCCVRGFIAAEGMTAEELRSMWKHNAKCTIKQCDSPTSICEFAKSATQQATAKGRRFLHSKNIH